MARFRKIDTRIHNDEKFRHLSDRGQLVFFKTLTHPHLTMIGAMRASIPGLAAEFNSPLEAFAEAFGELSASGMVRHDPSASLLWLPNFLKYNRPESPNVVKAWPDAFDLLPDCSLKCDLLLQLKGFSEGLSKGFKDAFIEAFPKAIAKTMPNQEQEQEPEAGEGAGGKEGAVKPPVIVHPFSEPDSAEPDSADTRILCERVGIFRIREQEEMNRCYIAFCRSSGMTIGTAMDHMVSRWEQFQASAPQMDWQWGSAHGFFMSGKWDQPQSWPRGKDARREEEFNRFEREA